MLPYIYRHETRLKYRIFSIRVVNTEVCTQILSWPDDSKALAAACEQCRPVLLLVKPGEKPPSMVNPLLDWVRVPATDEDIEFRISTLEERLRRSTKFEPCVPTVEDNVVRYGNSVVVVSPVEASLMGALLANGRSVVSRDNLVSAGWGDEEPERNTVDVAMARLRKKVEPVGITIRTIRSRGFLLELEDT